MENIGTFIVAITGLIAGIGSLIVNIAKAKARTTNADVTGDLARERSAIETYSKLAIECKERITQLTKRVTELENEREMVFDKIALLKSEISKLRSINHQLWCGIKILLQQITEAGMSAAWMPSQDWTEAIDELSVTPVTPSPKNKKMVWRTL